MAISKFINGDQRTKSSPTLADSFVPLPTPAGSEAPSASGATPSANVGGSAKPQFDPRNGHATGVRGEPALGANPPLAGSEKYRPEGIDRYNVLP